MSYIRCMTIHSHLRRHVAGAFLHTYLDSSLACREVGAHDEVGIHASHLEQNFTYTLHLRTSNKFRATRGCSMVHRTYVINYFVFVVHVDLEI